MGHYIVSGLLPNAVVPDTSDHSVISSLYPPEYLACVPSQTTLQDVTASDNGSTTVRIPQFESSEEVCLVHY